MKVYYEQVPDHYVGDYPAITITYRASDKHEAEVIGLMLREPDIEKERESQCAG